MHLHTSFSTDEVPAADRLACFREVLRKNAIPLEVYGENYAEAFSARAEIGAIGDLTVTRLTGHTPGRRGLRRTPDLIRLGDPCGYGLVLYQRGHTVLEHEDRRAELAPGDMTLIDTSHPFDGWYAAGSSRLVALTFPRDLLPVGGPAAERLRGIRLNVQTGVGALLRTVTSQLARDLGRYRPADVLRVSTTLLDLIGATLAAQLDAAGILPEDAQHRVLYARLQAFIETRLGDPALTPAAVAAAHHISTRTLQRLFAAQGHTVAGWIRGRRLERCARDLADPSMSDRPVHAIATRWGLPSAAHFSRLFRAAYGLSPQEYRRGFHGGGHAPGELGRLAPR